MKRLSDYRAIVGDETISTLYRTARKLYGKKILQINSTYVGGGVAEILNSLTPLLVDAGVESDWRILNGNPDFFNITKKFHNALQGDKINLTDIKKSLYLEANQDFSVYAHINHSYDGVVVHDPQPLPLIQFYKKRQPWFWRCHVDLSHPNLEVWDFLKTYIVRYDRVILSDESYRKNDLPADYCIFAPVIDPLSNKNKELSDRDISKYLKKFNVREDKPIITQISRFDKFKDPLGVIKVFEKVRQEIDCRLVLCGSMAADDPEGVQIYEKVKNRAESFIKKGDIVLITSENNILVNALQRRSAVILQKSLKEGFGLTVTEGLWKAKAVVAANVGGIPLQIIDEQTGFLVDPTDIDQTARTVVRVLQDPEMAGKVGRQGREHVRKNFLVTRLVSDYLRLFNETL
ncbi:MAG TPA: glycosyltransferase [bacterium]|nr:glycosyltransferase [bacterium]HNT66471.1 glycosyltransferase [bacterium]